MTSGPTLSVAMATYNGEKYIAEQLASLAAQTVLPSELVVSDDGSTDSTVSIVRAFAATAPFPVRIYCGDQRHEYIEQCNASEREHWLALLRRHDRLGFADNFLFCAHLCTGTLISFCDQDDIWLPAKNERSMAPFHDPEVGLVSCSATTIDARGKELGARLPDYRRDAVMQPLSHWPWENATGFSQTFRRELLFIIPSDVRPDDHLTDGVLPHDRWTFFLSHAYFKTVLLSEALVNYRRHGSNVTGSWSGRAPSIASQIAQIKKADSRLYMTMVLRAKSRAHVLKRSVHVDSSYFERHVNAIRYYERLNKLFSKRSRIYDLSISVMGRWFAVAEIFLAKGYRGKSEAGLGKGAMIKDLLQCLIGAIAR
jgi:glycosyltransferase involved in cell wall biosynthesis